MPCSTAILRRRPDERSGPTWRGCVGRWMSLGSTRRACSSRKRTGTPFRSRRWSSTRWSSRRRWPTAKDRLTAGDADGAVLGLDEALGLWSGPAYGEFADEEWASVEAIRLTALRTVARELRAESVLESGRHAAVIPDIEVLIEEEPFREEPRRLLMVALYRSGRHVDALRTGREYRRFLADETGLEPSREFDELEQLIVDQDPRLEARPQGRKLRGYVLGPRSPNQTSASRSRQHSLPSAATWRSPRSRPSRPTTSAFVRRFEVHAQRIASIEHVNVVPLYDYWREPGAAYLVTRYLAGGSLDRRVRERTMTDDERLDIVRQVGAALTAAHERGIVHGQLDATCVLFDDAGTAYLTGFSLDADPRSTPADIAALGQLAAEIWTQSTERHRPHAGQRGDRLPRRDDRRTRREYRHRCLGGQRLRNSWRRSNRRRLVGLRRRQPDGFDDRRPQSVSRSVLHSPNRTLRCSSVENDWSRSWSPTSPGIPSSPSSGRPVRASRRSCVPDCCLAFARQAHSWRAWSPANSRSPSWRSPSPGSRRGPCPNLTELLGERPDRPRSGARRCCCPNPDES